MNNQSILSQITPLQDMTVPELQDRWQELFGTKAPNISRAYLQRRLTYRIQELAHGGNALVENRLAAMNKQICRDGRKLAKRRKFKIAHGTKLVREYKGTEHHVKVLHDCFEYNGQRYNSLTRIAGDITGTWVSGPAFFGLTKAKRRPV